MIRLRDIAAKGYGWYVALKVGKALMLPIACVIWLAWATVSAVCIPIIRFLAGFVGVARDIPCDFRHHIGEKRWFTGFSRGHYLSLYGGGE